VPVHSESIYGHGWSTVPVWTHLYVFTEYDGSSRPFLNINFAKSAAGTDRRLADQSFAKTGGSQHGPFQTLHGDGSVDAIPPTDTCHQSILDDILQEVDPIVFEFDAQGGIHHRLGPSKISVRYTDVYVTRAFRKIGLALLDCLKRAEEVATEYMWTKSGRRDGKTSML
jgi:hypothetical protein